MNVKKSETKSIAAHTKTPNVILENIYLAFQPELA